MSDNFMIEDDEAEMIDQSAIGELARAIELVRGEMDPPGRMAASDMDPPGRMVPAGRMVPENHEAQLEPALVFSFLPAIIPIVLDENGDVIDDVIILD